MNSTTAPTPFVHKKTASEDAVFKLKCDAGLVGTHRCHYRVDIHAASFAVEAYVAVHKGEDRVVLAEADVLAGSELRSPLTDDDVAGNDCFATELFDTEALAVAVTAVFD